MQSSDNSAKRLSLSFFIKASIIVLTETKIDSSYPDSQFRMQNYRMYWNDRAKGGGGVLIYVSSKIPVKRLKPLIDFKTIEPLLLEVEFYSASTDRLGI